jgi:hypothetical protein
MKAKQYKTLSGQDRWLADSTKDLSYKLSADQAPPEPPEIRSKPQEHAESLFASIVRYVDECIDK